MNLERIGKWFEMLFGVTSDMGTVTINGKTFVGNNICIRNGKMVVDGKTVEDGLSGIVKVKLEGDLASLDCDASIEMTGSVHGDVDAGNSVHCGNVQGSVDAGNSVHCGSVGGNVKAGNSIYRG